MYYTAIHLYYPADYALFPLTFHAISTLSPYPIQDNDRSSVDLLLIGLSSSILPFPIIPSRSAFWQA